MAGPLSPHAVPVTRVLVIDDNAQIAEDFSRILRPPPHDDALDLLEDDLFGAAPRRPSTAVAAFEIDAADNGRLGCEMARRARLDAQPYALAFVDMRMPGGWDGIRTVEELRRADDQVQVVICTAHSDCEPELADRLGAADRLRILRKPVDPAEVQQVARAIAGSPRSHGR